MYVCMNVCMSVVSITPERTYGIDLRCSNFVCGLMVSMGPGNKDFVKIAHAQKVDAIENMFFSDYKKTALTILIKIAVRVPLKVF